MFPKVLLSCDLSLSLFNLALCFIIGPTQGRHTLESHVGKLPSTLYGYGYKSHPFADNWIVLPDITQTFQASGVVTSYAVAAFRTGDFRIQIWKEDTKPFYQLINELNVHTITESEMSIETRLEIDVVDESIRVNAGEVVGIQLWGENPIGENLTAHTSTRATLNNADLESLQINEYVKFEAYLDLALGVSVHVVYDQDVEGT